MTQFTVICGQIGPDQQRQLNALSASSTLGGLSVTTPDNTAPFWSTIPTQQLNSGGSVDLSGFLNDPGGQVVDTLASGLDAGLSYDPATLTITDDGTQGPRIVSNAAMSLLHNPTAEEDWQWRSTQPGVVRAWRPQSQADVDAVTFQDSTADHVQYETTIRRSGNGALRMNVLTTDNTASGSARMYLAEDQRRFGNGSEFWVQYALYWDPPMRQYCCPGTYSGVAGGPKASIISHYAYSNTAGEVVLQNLFNRGFVQAYRNPGFLQFDESRSTPCSATDFSFQPALDVGVPVSPSNCAEYKQRYGSLYSYGSPSVGDITLQGHPDPNAMVTGTAMPSGDWVIIEFHIAVGTFGTASTTVELWAYRPGTPRKLIVSQSNVLVDNNAGETNYDAIWLLPYESEKTSAGDKPNTFVCYDELIVSTEQIPIARVA